MTRKLYLIGDTVTVNAAARIAGVHRSTIIRAIEGETLIASRSSERAWYRIKLADLEKWMGRDAELGIT